jgi:sulfite reductase beta subunit-like hemoprotein
MFLKLRLSAPDCFLARLEVVGMLSRTTVRRSADFSTRQTSQQLRGISARVVYNGAAGLHKTRLEKKR